MFPRWRRHYPARWQAMLARLNRSRGAEFLSVRIDSDWRRMLAYQYVRARRDTHRGMIKKDVDMQGRIAPREQSAHQTVTFQRVGDKLVG